MMCVTSSCYSASSFLSWIPFSAHVATRRNPGMDVVYLDNTMPLFSLLALGRHVWPLESSGHSLISV
jgi:hypothetical protein